MELGIDFELDNFLEDGCHSVGIRIPKPKRPRLAIELVPPQRFTVNKPHRLLAEAVSSCSLCASSGPHLPQLWPPCLAVRLAGLLRLHLPSIPVLL